MSPRSAFIAVSAIAAVTLTLPAPAQSPCRTCLLLQQRSSAVTERDRQSRMLGALVYTDLSVQFTETPAREALAFIARATGVTIVPRFDDDRMGFGMDPDTPITLIADHQPALTVIELVLEQCEEPCTWQLGRGVVEVGPKDRLAQHPVVRYYTIHDLMAQPPDYDNAPTLDLQAALNQSGANGASGGGSGFGAGAGSGAGSRGGGIIGEAGDDPIRAPDEERAQAIVNIIEQTIEPEGWASAGGDWGTIAVHRGLLIVRAPDFVHRQIDGYPFRLRPPGPAPEPRRATFTKGATSIDPG